MFFDGVRTPYEIIDVREFDLHLNQFDKKNGAKQLQIN